jgi:hypothetical protein
MFTLQARDNHGLFLHVRPDGSIWADAMSADQAAADPSCHFNWSSDTTPFTLQTADGRFVEYGEPPAWGVEIIIMGLGCYIDSGDLA